MKRRFPNSPLFISVILCLSVSVSVSVSVSLSLSLSLSLLVIIMNLTTLFSYSFSFSVNVSFKKRAMTQEEDFLLCQQEFPAEILDLRDKRELRKELKDMRNVGKWTTSRNQ